jgi:hypothetical protein
MRRPYVKSEFLKSGIFLRVGLDREFGIAPVGQISSTLFRQISVEERGHLAEVLPGLGRIRIGRILRMRLAFEDMEIRDDASLTQFTMHAYCIRQEQITRARRENGRRESGEISIYR